MLSRFYFFLVILLLTFYLDTHAQTDSISSLTITEYQDDTIYWQDLIIQNFYENKLIFEVKKIGLGRDDSEIETTTNFYDLYGNLSKTIRIEEDRYECPPEPISDQFGVTTFLPEYVYFPVDSENVTLNPLIIPDSMPFESKFCGRFFTKTSHYSPYTVVTNSWSYYDDGDTTYSVDSLFLDRYGDDLRKVTYVNKKKYLEYQYRYVRDRQGRITTKYWDNLTPGGEFSLKDEYVYNGEQKLQVYHSSHFPKRGREKTSSRTFYDDNFEIVKHENYQGDSLTSIWHYQRRDGFFQSISMNAFGDTTVVLEYIKKRSKKRAETWSLEERGSVESFYGISDTIRKKDGYCIESKRYRITKEQFLKQENSMNSRNRILYKSKKYFDKNGRLVRELKYDSDELESEFTYEYKILN